MSERDDNARQDALDYHSREPPGKIEVRATKPMQNQWDLSLAYSPGVAEPCLEIAKRPDDVFRYTARGNLVGVITNGSAVLGLGNIGALASKPVMEGKAVLFKKFAGIDSIDIEIDEQDPKKFIETVAPMWPESMSTISANSDWRCSSDVTVIGYHTDAPGSRVDSI